MKKVLLTIFFSFIIILNVSSAQLEDYDLMSAGQIKREIINKNLFGYYHKSKKSFSEIYSSNKILTFKTEGKTYYAKWKFKGRKLCAKFNEASSYECVKVLKQQKNGKFYYFFANDDGVFAGATVVGSGAKLSLKEKKSKDVVLKCSNKTNGTKSIIINEEENKIIFDGYKVNTKIIWGNKVEFMSPDPNVKSKYSNHTEVSLDRITGELNAPNWPSEMDRLFVPRFQCTKAKALF